MKLITIILLLICFILPDIWAWGGGKSRGGGRVSGFNSSNSSRSHTNFSRSRSSSLVKSSQYASGGRSSSSNVHLLHNRNVATLPTPKYNNRTEAMEAFRKSQEFQKITTTKFSQEPLQRPDYIPNVITKDNQRFSVIFQNGTYGYTKGRDFFPLQAQDYNINDYVLRKNLFHYRGMVMNEDEDTEGQNQSSWGWVIGLAIVFGLVFFLVHALTYNNISYKKKSRDEEEAPHIDEKDFEEFADSSKKKKALPNDPNLGTSGIAPQIRNLLRGKIVTLSDRLTLENFDRPLDFTVTHSVRYFHPTFSMQHVVLENNSEKDRLELHLFCKEVQGQFALYLGMLDHEGTDKKLRESEWYHLRDDGKAFSEFFASIFDMKSGDKKMVFSQFEFGAFYEITCSGAERNISLCEYFPEEPPQSFDWQHAVVIWEKDWISCYYCIEIHDRNIVLY